MKTKLNTDKLLDIYNNYTIKQDKTYKVYKHNYNDLVKNINESYIEKSSRYFSYFVNNILFSKNSLTDEYYCSHYDNDNVFKYIRNIELKENDFNIIEENKGHYLAQQDKLYSLKIFSKVNYLEYVNKGTIKQFITLTLPSEYHRYKIKNNVKNKAYKQSNFVENENYKYSHLDFEEVINIGIKKLNEIERRLQIEFNKYVTRHIKKVYQMTLKEYKETYNSNIINKIKMIEPHKSLTPHLHSMYWIEPEFVEIFNKVYNNIIKLYDLNNEFCKNETIEKAKASTYIMKYLMKNLNDTEENSNDTDSTFANKYRRYFSSSRFFTSSNFKDTNQKEIDTLYKYLNKNNKAFLEYLKGLKTPLYYSLEQLIIKKVIVFEYEELERTKVLTGALKLELAEVETWESSEDRGDIITSRGMYQNILNKIEEGYYLLEEDLKTMTRADINLNFLFSVGDSCKNFETVMNNIDNYIKEDTYNTIYQIDSMIKTKLTLERVKEIVSNPFKIGA